MKRFLIFVVALIGLLAIGSQFIDLYWKYEYGQKAPRVDLIVGKTPRNYYLLVPDNLSAPAPLLLAFHGGGGGGWRFPDQQLLERLGTNEGFIIAFPEAKHLEPNEGSWQLNTRENWKQDINYISALIEDIASQHSVDRKRVYGIGYSLGAMLIYELACHMSDRFAALASYAGTMPRNQDSCDQTNPIPILHVHGKQDKIIAYDTEWDWKSWASVGTMRDIPSLVNFWTDKYHCAELKKTIMGDVQHIEHYACDGNSRIELYSLDKQSHDWPATINDLSTHRIMWDFLSKFHLD